MPAVSDCINMLDSETKAVETPEDHAEELRLWLRLLTCTTLIEGEVRGLEGDVAVVAVDGQTTRAAHSGDLRVGRRASISVRPEALRLARSTTAPAEGTRGVVSDVLFLGSQIRYVVKLSSGRQLKSDVASNSELFAVGDAVTATWDPASVVALASSDAGAHAVGADRSQRVHLVPDDGLDGA